MDEALKLEQAIAALEAQRAILGDDVVQVALGPLRQRLAALQSIPASQSLETQQRRMLTILFADVSGYTAISEHLDAEDVRDTMNELWQKLDSIILSLGGKIDKHMGDGVMALWGADETREDDAERALRAALQMQEALSFFRPAVQAAVGLKMRIGLNTGPVLLGSIGSRGEMTALGDAVNLASRLEQACPAGGVLISHDTYRHVRGVFDVLPQDPLEVKGKSDTVRTYLVTALKPRAFRQATRGVEGIETRMIGREIELTHLQQAFQGSFLGNKGLQVVTISGDAGIGKSRLLYEFNTWAEVQPLNWWVFKGRASLAAQHTPYALLRDIFLFRFEIQDSDSLAVAHEKIEQGFREFLPDDPDALEKAHVLGHLVGLDFSSSPHLRGLLDDPRQLRQQALYYLTRFFRAASDQLPSLLMLDDLHWADTGSVDALSYLFTNLPPQTRLLTVAVTRPTLFEFYPTWGCSLAGFSRIELSPLDKADSRRLVEEILRKVPDLPDAIRELVVGGAEGNPFYLEEFVKMLIDEKVICPGDEAWRVESGRLASLNVPSTLTEIIHARLDGLSSEERIILQYASVYGRIFWDDALLAFSPDITHQSLSQTFQILLRKELIYERIPSAFAGTREFTFRQSLLQEVTYETLLKRQRAAYHLRAAHWLDQASGERRGEYLAQIADHYERGGETGHAAGVLSQAAERALGLSALAEARAFFQHALSLLDQPDRPLQDVVQVELGLAEACLELGEYPQALRHAETASNMAADLQLDSLVAEALTLLGQISINLGSHQDARSYLVGSLYLARQENTHSTLARVLVALATVEWKLGDLDSALQNCEHGLQIARQVSDATIELMAINRLGVIHGALGSPQLEASYYHQALDLALAVGNRERAATAYNNLGALAGEQDDWGKAWEYYQRTLQISSETGAKQAKPCTASTWVLQRSNLAS